MNPLRGPDSTSTGAPRPAPPLHLFAPRRLTPGLGRVLAPLSSEREVHAFALNPCREFWDDIDLDRDGARDRDPDRDRTTPTDPALLRRFGRTAQLSTRILNELGSFHFTAHFAEPSQASTLVLHALQQDILARAPHRPVLSVVAGPDSDEHPIDRSTDSVVVLACPNMKREIEAVAQYILEWMSRSTREAGTEGPSCSAVEGHASGSGSRPHPYDIAIMMPDHQVDAYLPHVQAVFEERGDLPSSVVGVPMAQTSRPLETIQRLLDLPFSRFTRGDVLEILTQPALIARFDQSGTERPVAWCDAVGIAHGRDTEDHRGTYIERDLYNWDQGLVRLVLGCFLSGERSGDTRTFDTETSEYLPHATASSEHEAVAFFESFARSLISDARFAARVELTLTEWSAFLRCLVTTYVAVESEHEERDLARSLGVIDSLRDLDASGRRVTFTVASELFRSKLGTLRTGSGRPFLRGVCVGPLSILAGFPFRLVFIVGLGEGLFPRTEPHDSIDLTCIDPRSSDVSLATEDRQCILDAIMGTSDELILSYVARDARTGDTLESSAVVTEIVHALPRTEKGRDPVEAAIRRPPLRRYDDERRVPPLDLRATRERAARALGADLRRHLGRLLPSSIWDLEGWLPEGAFAELRDDLRLLDAPSGGHTACLESPLLLSYETLWRFLEDPFAAWVQYVLRARREGIDGDPLLVDSEAFETRRRSLEALLEEVFFDHLRGLAAGTPRELWVVYDECARRYELTGLVPTGVFLEADRAQHLVILSAWRAHAERAVGSTSQGPSLDRFRFGRAREHARVRTVDRAVTFEIDLPGRTDPVVVELSGATQPLSSDARSSVALVARRRIDETLVRRCELRCFLDQVVLAALGRSDGRPFRAWIAAAVPELKSVWFDAIDQEGALTYLKRLTQDLLSTHHAYALPFTAVLKVRDTMREHPLDRPRIERALESASRRWGTDARRTAFINPDTLSPPRADIAIEMISRRFGPYFERRRGE